MNDGQIFFARHEGIGVLRFEGTISYLQAPALDRFLDGLFKVGDFRTILVDLNDTESIDSTGLGLLARIAKFLRARDGGKPLLLSSRVDINEILRSICLDSVFTLCENPVEFEAARTAGNALSATEASESELARTVLNAHRLLCEMNEANRAMFQSVVDAFESETRKP